MFGKTITERKKNVAYLPISGLSTIIGDIRVGDSLLYTSKKEGFTKIVVKLCSVKFVNKGKDVKICLKSKCEYKGYSTDLTIIINENNFNDKLLSNEIKRP